MMPTADHPTDDTLILHYYGETGDAAAREALDAHVAACPVCRDELARLSATLGLVADAVQAPEPGPAFEREMWARLQPELAAARPSWWARLRTGAPAWAWGAGLAAVILAAFVAGRLSTEVAVPPQTAAADSTDLAERLLVVAVVDHLDRSQLVLLEVLNGDATDAAQLEAEQIRARDLITSNRLYRQTAVQTGDLATTAVLDELERVLLEIANASPDAGGDQVPALRARLAASGLMFRVRVVRAQLRDRDAAPAVVSGSQS